MKKLISILLLILMSISCKDPVSPVSPKEVTPVIIFKQTPLAEIKVGTNAVFSWELTTESNIKEYVYSLNNTQASINTNSKIFTGLVGGSYTFTIKAVTTSGKESNKLSYSFKVKVNPPPNPGEVTLQDNAMKIPEADLSKITAMTDNSITFDNPSSEIQSLKVGDVIYGVTSTYPSRLISRKITGRLTKVGNTKGFWTFVTQIASLAEIFKEGRVEINSKIIDFYRPPQKILLYDLDGSAQTTNDQTNLYAGIDLDATLGGEINFANSLTASLKFKFSGELDLSLISQANLDLEKEVSIGSLSSGILTAGPLVFRVNSEIYARLEADIEGDFSTGMIGRMDFNAEATYSGSWTMTKDLNLSMEKKETTFELEGGVKLTLGITADIMFYEAGGPSVGVEPYFYLDLNSSRNPFLELYAGIDGKLGVEAGWLLPGVGSKYWTITGPRNLIYSSGNSNSPPLVPSNPFPQNGATNVLATTQISWSCADSDGDIIKYDLFLGKNPTPSFYGTTYLREAIFNLEESTKYYWYVKAIDEHGASSTSPVWSFTTEGSGGEEKYYLSFKVLCVDDIDNPTQYWSTEGYHLQIYSNDNLKSQGTFDEEGWYTSSVSYSLNEEILLEIFSPDWSVSAEFRGGTLISPSSTPFLYVTKIEDFKTNLPSNGKSHLITNICGAPPGQHRFKLNIFN